MRKSGFTLAEVLITLVIIGVIAAMTVPTLMNNTNSQEFRSALKKAISALNQAVTMQYALEGTMLSDFNSSNVVSQVFQARLNVISTESSAWAATGAAASCAAGQFVTADGMAYCITSFSTAGGDTGACNNAGTEPCGRIYIDVNGSKKPNTMTTSATQPKDVYQATLYSQRVVPYDTPTQQVMYDAGLQ